jgi:hypothetical protein
MRIDAVTVCVNYADFLAWTLPVNKTHFNRMVVVTAPEDRRTRDICEYNHVECLTTNAFYKKGATFNKCAGINEGLRQLGSRDWICHLDADIVLPPRSREMLGKIDLQPDMIYGIDRLMCRSFDDWTRYVSKPEVQHSCDTFIQANAFPLGVRVGKLSEEGWLPIGFFQLWNAGETGVDTYPEHGEADRGDMPMGRKWPRAKRALIPEIVGIHLESESMINMGANWSGRTTREFGLISSPSLPESIPTPPSGAIADYRPQPKQKLGWLKKLRSRR